MRPGMRATGCQARTTRIQLQHAPMRGHLLAVRAASSPGATSKPAAAAAAVDMQERMAFLREDLTHLFDDKGVDESQYDDVVTFLDPITRYNNVQGYMFNIRMLKSVFAPVFELHDIRQTGPLELTTRWTMTMTFTPAKALRLSKWWYPVITFTGTSSYGFNPANGRINRHVDTWDSITNQRFFSLEAFGDFFQQLLQPFTTPPLDTPRYTLLRRAAGFQIRRYEPFLVAQAPLDNLENLPPPAAAGDESSSSSRGINPASVGIKAFNALAGYIFGGNAAGTRLKMTTPVLSSTDGTMQFVVSTDPQQVSLSSLPDPVDPSAVQLQQQPGGLFAAAVFSGVATPRRCREVQQQLVAALAEAGLQPSDAGSWSLARYNDPSVAPRSRRNEILMQLKEFDLWG